MNYVSLCVYRHFYEALVVLPWQRHQLAPQEPATTGGRAQLEERDERREKTKNSATHRNTTLLL